MDAKSIGNIGRYLNHRWVPSLVDWFILGDWLVGAYWGHTKDFHIMDAKSIGKLADNSTTGGFHH